jgi:hypothetical protein
VHWQREVIDERSRHRSLTFLGIFPMTAAVGGESRTPSSASSLRLAPSWKLDEWTDKLRRSELDIRDGAWRKFDIDEAITTSDLTKESRASGKEPGSR